VRIKTTAIIPIAHHPQAIRQSAVSNQPKNQQSAISLKISNQNQALVISHRIKSAFA
jgi:hypothetical protein